MSKPKPPRRLMLDIQAWKNETSTLTAAERGALLALKMHLWSTGPIPARDQSLAQIVGMGVKEWRDVRRALEPLFQVAGGEWIRADWNDELDAAYEAVAKAVEKSRKGNEARWSRRSSGSFESGSDALEISSGAPSGIPPGIPTRTPSGIPARILNIRGEPPMTPAPAKAVSICTSTAFENDVFTAEQVIALGGAR